MLTKLYSPAQSPISRPMGQITLLLYVIDWFLYRRVHIPLFDMTQVDGKFQRVYGTSCSAPVTGAIFTMINDARLAIGKGPIGFINPTVSFPVTKYDGRGFLLYLLCRSTLPSFVAHSTTLLKAVILVAVQRVTMQLRDGTQSLVWEHPTSPTFSRYGCHCLRWNRVFLLENSP